MNNSLQSLMALFATLFLSACSLIDFSDKECEYRGVLAATCRWEQLGMEEPPEAFYRDMQWLCDPLPDVLRFEAKTCHRSLAVGRYDLLLFKQGDNLIRGVEHPFTAEIHAPLEERNGRTYIAHEQQFVFSGVKMDVAILTDDTTRCTFSPLPLVQQITIHLVVKGIEALPEIEWIRAELSGVTVFRRLASREKGAAHAIKAFTFLPEVEPDRFSRRFFVLGINGEAENLLHLQMGFASGGKGETTLALDDLLDSFEARSIEITLEVDVSPALSLTAIISHWLEKDMGGIVIQ
jgi:hypothetical protein